MITYATILTERYSGSQWSMADETYESLIWYDDTEKPTKEELDALWTSVEEELLLRKTIKENAIATAIQKLSALGLTEEEARAIAGL